MLKRYLMVFLLFFLCLNAAFAQDDSLKKKIDAASSDVSSFFNSISTESIVVVKGSKISVEDKIFFNMIKSQLDLPGLAVYDDKHMPADDKNIVFLGSEKTNRLAKELAPELENRTEKNYAPLILETAYYKGKKTLIIYSHKEKLMIKNNAVSRSPLSRLMDEKYVPAAATFLSILLMYLWQVAAKTLLNFLNEAASSKVLDKKASNHKIKKNEFLNKQEVIAFIAYVLIFAFSIAYSWSSGLSQFIKLLLINFAIIGIISLVREVARLKFCYEHKLRSEFVLWPFGSVLTVISTFLGNTFSIASYTLLDEDLKDEKKFGRSAYTIAMLTFLLAIAAYLLNIFFPSIVLQLTFVFSIMLVFIEMFPMSPMAGDDMRKWSFPLWLASYVVVIASYIFLNFTVYV